MGATVTRVIDILKHQAEHYPLDIALSKKSNGKWDNYSTIDFLENVNALSLGLLELGVKPGEKVAIISFNRPEWNFVDFAVQQIGAISVPMYPTITVEDYTYIFNDAGVKAVFVETEEIANKVAEATKDLEYKIDFFTFNDVQGQKKWTYIKDLGKNRSIDEIKPLSDAIKSEDLLTLIYTSGTTGKPKGVMISNSNLVQNVINTKHLMPVEAGEAVLSFLPLCHVFERMITYLYMYKGISIRYAESMETIGADIKDVQPMMFSTVPRLLEKVYDKIMAKGAELKGIKKMLFYWAVKLGEKNKINVDQGFIYNTKLKIANKLVFSKWREALGGNIRTVVSGSAPLQPRLATIFWAAQIPIMEGYGLTETSPVISVNEVVAENNRIGTVGRVIDGVEVKIAEDGEILVRGHNIMMGYYNKPDITARNIVDGWLHTGDIGEFVDEEYLKITDRKKEMFKTSGGKYVAPALLENKFKESPIVEQVMVVGEGQKFPGALFVPNFDSLRAYCAHKKINYTTDAEMINDPQVLDKFERILIDKNKTFAKFEQVKQFRILPKLWTIDGGELTPTLKLKRKAIREKYADVIQHIYDNC